MKRLLDILWAIVGLLLLSPVFLIIYIRLKRQSEGSPLFAQERIEKDDRYTQPYAIRPGITSEATLYNGYIDTMEKILVRLEMDLKYLAHRSLFLDFQIVIKTVFSIIKASK